MSAEAEAPYLLGLPDEVLDQVVSNVLVYPERDWWPPDFDKFFDDALAILLTCHRFYRLAIPHLYRRLEIAWGREGFRPSATETATRHLHRTLKEDYSLRRHCLDLCVHISDLDSTKEPSQQSLTVDVVTWLTRVQRLNVLGGSHASALHHRYGNSTLHIRDLDIAWDVTSAAVRNMPDLLELTVTPAFDAELNLPRLMGRSPRRDTSPDPESQWC